MNTELIKKVEKSHIRKDLPNFKVGDVISVDTIIRDADKARNQRFTGLVIAIKGSGTRKSFTVRKVSYGVGVEKIYPWNSTNIAAIELVKPGSVRRSKIFYMRDRVGKGVLKVKPGKPAPVIEHEQEAEEAENAAPELAEDIVVEEPAVVIETAETEAPAVVAENVEAPAEEKTEEAA